MTWLSILFLVLGVLVLAVLALGTWWAVRVDQRVTDHRWHFCAWCDMWWHEKTGVHQLKMPSDAPLVNGLKSHGICPHCTDEIESCEENLDGPARSSASQSETGNPPFRSVPVAAHVLNGGVK